MAHPQDNFCVTEQWYLIQCKYQKEHYAASMLKEKFGLHVFFPEYPVCSRGQTRNLPLFPGYLFARIDLQRVPVSHVNTCPGVLRLVDFDDDPPAIPNCIIEKIAQFSHRKETYIAPTFENGDKVYMRHNDVLRDIEMIFVRYTSSRDRVCVLINLLGRLKETYIDVKMLEKLHNQNSA